MPSIANLTDTLSINEPISKDCYVYDNGQLKHGYIIGSRYNEDSTCTLAIVLDTDSTQAHTDEAGQANEGKAGQQGTPDTPSHEDSPYDVNGGGTYTDKSVHFVDFDSTVRRKNIF